MKGILYKPDILAAKLRVLEEKGVAVARRLNGLKEINEDLNSWECTGTDGIRWGFKNRFTGKQVTIKSPYHPGQVVYVKKAWAVGMRYNHYKPSEIPPNAEVWYQGELGGSFVGKWRSPLFMPERFARYFHQIIDVRPERLQEITVQDAVLEGITLASDSLNWVATTIDHYRQLWNRTCPDYSWELNPYVWRIEFKKAERPSVFRS